MEQGRQSPAAGEAVATTETPGAGGAATGTAPVVGSATETPGLPVAGNHNFGLLTKMLNFPVVDQSGAQVGTVNDMVLNLCTARLDYVIVILTGTAVAPETAATGTAIAPGSATATTPNGAGSVIAIPWEVLSVVQANSFSNHAGMGTATPSTTATTGMSGPDKFLLASTVTEAMLMNAPTFDVDTATSNGVFNANWDSALRSYWGLPASTVPADCDISGACGAQSTATSVAPGMATGTPSAVGTGVAGSGGVTNPQFTSMDLSILAHTLQATVVNDQAGNTVGIITDGVVLTTSGLIRYQLLSPFASLHANGQFIVVPTHAFSYTNGAMGTAVTATPAASQSSSNVVLTLNVPSSTLQNAPTVNPNDLPNMAAPGWDVTVRSFWSNENVVIPN